MNTNNTIKELEALQKELLDKAAQVGETIATMRMLSSLPLVNGHKSANGHAVALHSSLQGSDLPDNYKDYNKDATTRSKLALVLRKENRFLHIRQIAEILHGLEPAISAKDFVSKLYPAVAELKKQGTLVKYNVGGSNINSFWGSKNWLDGEGNPKPEHKYDEDQLTAFTKESIEI